MDEDLLPCPFCGELPAYESTPELDVIRCDFCSVRMEYEGSGAVLRVKWNNQYALKETQRLQALLDMAVFIVDTTAKESETD